MLTMVQSGSFASNPSKTGKEKLRALSGSEIFGDLVIATTILDRLLHHSHIVNIRGRAWPSGDSAETSWPSLVPCW